jgi:hypothetical protein
MIASHDDIVHNIASRLDDLQSKISSVPENALGQQQRSMAGNSADHLNARVATLENIHEDALHRLNAKLESVERNIGNNKEAEYLMGNIVNKFSQLETRLKDTAELRDKVEKNISSNKEAEVLMGKIATKFSALESRLQNTVDLTDRVNHLETKVRSTGSTAELHDRLTTLESKVRSGGVSSDLHDRVAQLESKAQTHHRRVSTLEAKMEPDPEQEKILARINAKLDMLEKQKRDNSLRSSDNEPSRSLGARYGSLGAKYDSDRSLGARAFDHEPRNLARDDNEDQIRMLKSRINKLQELRSRYENE